ncbi:OsmC family protein [Candidatus Vecturithrix granuli]|uniref:OsmC family protein n=1 Tax=Vecturithrix granuli TaxID=1499967 RepID=A0A081C838_VECG1|nr:OsmC family protein [Candidatus Vecturithrix granuli]
MYTKKVLFMNIAGERLSASLEMPTNERPVAYALFAHCFTCSKEYKAVTYISRTLAQEHIAVLRFDFTGLGESDGDFSETNFSSNVADIFAAAAYLQQHYEAPQLLIGHSLGGTAMLQAAARIPSSVAVVTIASPFEPRIVLRHLDRVRAQIEIEGQAQVTLAGRDFLLKKQFVEDLEQADMSTTIRELKRALLIFHSPADTVLELEQASKIFQTARHPKSFISLDQADHLLSNREDALYVGIVIAAWVRKYLVPTSVMQKNK